MGAISSITNSISSALGTDGSGGGLLGGVSQALGTNNGNSGGLLSNPVVDVGLGLAADYFSGGALSGTLASFMDPASAGALGIAAPASGALSAAGDFGANAVAADATASAAPDAIAAAASGIPASASGASTAAGDFSAGTFSAPATPASTGPIGSDFGAGYNPAGTVATGPASLASTAAGGSPLTNAAATAGATNLLSPKGILSGLNDINAIQQGNQLNQTAQGQQQSLDPLAPNRSNAAQQLLNLQNNPGAITSMPGYQAGLDAMQRQLAAQGLGSSTTGQAQIAAYGQQFYQQQLQQLAALATPTAGATTAANNVLSANTLGNKATNSAYGNLISMLPNTSLSQLYNPTDTNNQVTA